jgi:hypothetical protein
MLFLEVLFLIYLVGGLSVDWNFSFVFRKIWKREIILPSRPFSVTRHKKLRFLAGTFFKFPKLGQKMEPNRGKP